ncbi:lipocalin family protein [Pontibacter sp. KCTC 32443]|uniref:lipocalin family protein n=1 Tax=Pontibacter TaxID=323449 RepID=UPI00164D30B0|nr:MULTISPECIES: lipocalin family protein [Pontibacter]MBC5774986.1 lipocalin family protein [Pontibacter sp. KCTC 32443]
MKKLQFLTYLFAALLMVTTVSCDEDDDDTTPDKESLLTAGEWTGDKIYVQGVDATDDFAELFDFDVKNSTISFSADGTYTADSDFGSDEGTWEFSEDETQIILDEGTDDETTVEVNRLTSSEFWAEGDLADMGQDVEIRFVR